MNEGVPLFPDVSLRGHLSRLFNARDFELTVGGIDLGVGKPFPVGGMITLTPYAGWNLVWVAATSRQIDFDPTRPYGDTIATDVAQLESVSVYDRGLQAGANAHNRFYVGVRFIGGVIQLLGEMSFSNLGRNSDTGNGDPSATAESLPPVIAFNTSIGLDF